MTLLQQRVADRVAVVVVDVLEIVEVDEGDREAPRALVAADRLLDALLDQGAVGQAGQVVEIGAPRQLVLDALAVADVERARHQELAVEDVHRLAGGEPGPLAARVGEPVLGGERRARLHQADLPLAPLRRLLGRQEVGRRGADQLLGGHRQVGGGDRVDQDEAAVLVLHGQADRQEVDQRAVELAVLGSLALAGAQLIDQPAQAVDLTAELLAVAHGERGEPDDRALPRVDDEIGGEIRRARGAPQQQGGVPPLGRDRNEQGGLVGGNKVGRNERAVTARALARLAGGQHENAAAHGLRERRGGGPLPVSAGSGSPATQRRTSPLSSRTRPWS